MRPSAPKQIVRQYTYVYAAVSPELGKMTSLILPYANTDMMTIFLKELSSEFKEYFILLLVDKAAWHTSAKLEVPENIHLIKQPSHSPELNPAEHIWEELREKHFYNRAFSSIDEVEDELCIGLNSLNENSEKLRSMTNFPYLNITH